ncbi:MAG: hypothetical protein LBK62_13030 [Treponema sp.]|jgi:hypothetical protein|nr:hypothetical protein [Treponema sp.]
MVFARSKCLCIFLLYALCGTGILFAGGHYEDRIGVVSADELYEYDFKLYDRIPREIKEELGYADSINAYWYNSENSAKIFNKAYFYLKWNKIVQISLSSVIGLESDFTLEEYKPEYVMKVCKDAYGEPETEWKRYRSDADYPAGKSLACRWKINNVIVEYSYLPYNDFNELKAAALGRGSVAFHLRYFIQKDK